MLHRFRWLKSATRHRKSSGNSKLNAVLRTRHCRLEMLEELTLLTAVPTGTNIQVPSQNVTLNQTNPHVATDSIGDFVVVYEEEVSANDNDIYVRRYTATGVAKGPEIAVAATTLDQTNPRVDMAGDGSFVVVWQELSAAGDTDIFFRRFDSSGNALSLPTLAYPVDPADQTDPDIAVFPTGTFVITWVNQTTATNSDIQFRRFVSNGSPLDATARDLADTSQNETQGRVAANKAVNADRFMVVWTELSPDGDTDVKRDLRSIFSGDTISGAAVVSDNSGTEDRNHFNPSVDMDVVGNSVITYAEEVSASDHDLYLRRYNNIGVALTTDPQVVEDQASLDTKVSEVGMAENSTFVVTYIVENGTAGTSDIKFQRFAADGTKFAGPQIPDSPQLEPGNATVGSIAMNALGDFTIVWQDDVFASVFGQLVFARNYRTPLDTIGLYNPPGATFFLRNSNSSGVADIAPFNFGSTVPQRWMPIAGDWDGDGIDTIGVYEPSAASFFLRNSNNTGVADISLNFGSPGWIPVAGDWDGDGLDTIGAFDPVSAMFFLRNSNTTGVADITLQYGPGTTTWLPVIGDWNGDGIDTIGLYNPRRGSPQVGRFLLRNSNTTGMADIAFNFNTPDLKPLSGDWNRDGVDTIGTFDPSTAIFSLRNSNTAGGPDIQFVYGSTSPPLTEAMIPIAADWNGPGAPGLVASTVIADSGTQAATIEANTLQPIINEAVARWELVGLSEEQANLLTQVSVVVEDLPGNFLGQADGSYIALDRDAAGHGWFVDLTPADDEEFVEVASELAAIDDSEAAQRVDLLTTIAHEMGHLLGLGHSVDEGSVMLDTLLPGIRRSPDAAAIDYLLG